ncbi:hypothetical protein UPYG_G00227590 [Umbra pygmaea]|uniref:Immunoglobulin C1-set domain-containing protein n=1 Tax=Umbra pygmaea TaxID=75934 RepID=A0ABD0WI27_UMBPY
MDALLVIGLVFSFYTSVVAGSGSHSIWCLATYIVGESPFPEFTVVVMLDDIQVDYYDSNDNQDKAEQGLQSIHINLTLLRDGEPIADQELTGGEVLPNGDGTYQVRKTLEVSTEELREKHNYTCTASHRSLDNKLDVSWVPELGGVKEGPISFLVPLGIVAICCVISLLCVYICIKRKHSTASSKTSPQLSVTENESEQSSLCLKECTN